MKSNPLVSVIIPTRNSSQFLDKCLSSIKNQSYKNIEIIVVDNNSTDDTKEIAKKYTNIVFNWGPEPSAQRNYGADHAKGKFLLIHDSDIYFNNKSIEECVNLMETEKYDALILPEKSIGIGYWAKVKSYERSFYIGNDYIEATRLFDKNVYKKIGGYDETLCGPEDWDLTVRLRKAGFKIGRTKNILEHDEGKVSFLGSSIKKKYYSKDVFEKYAKKHPKEFKMQMNFFVRFPIDKILMGLLNHPILTISMFIMKAMELLISLFN